MGEELDGAELFESLMHPETTTGEVTEMDFGTLAQRVGDRRWAWRVRIANAPRLSSKKWKVPQAAISFTLTDEQIAQAILDYARSVSPDTNVNPSTKAPSSATARNEFLGRLFLILGPIFLGIWGWVAYDRAQVWDGVAFLCPGYFIVLALLVLILLAWTTRAFVRFRRVAGSSATRTLAITGGPLLLITTLAVVLVMPPLSGSHLELQLLLGKDNWYRAELDGFSLKEVDLSGANLRWAHMHAADLRGANLRGIKARHADLTGADLRGAQLKGANLTGADLTGADLTGADLSEAFLEMAAVTDEQLAQAASLKGATLPDGSVHK